MPVLALHQDFHRYELISIIQLGTDRRRGLDQQFRMPAPLLLNMLMNSLFVGKNLSCLGRMPTNIFIEERLQSIPVLIDKQGLDKTIYAGVNKERGGFHSTSPFAVSGIMERGGSDKLSLHRLDIERK